MTTRLGDAPINYDPEWTGNMVRTLEGALDTLENPANRGNYETQGLTDKRDLDEKSSLDDIRNTLGTLIKDLRSKGVIQ